MAFTPQEEAQLRLIILSFLSGKAIADLENADPATISGALIEVVQNGVSKKTSISEFFTGSPAGVKASLTALQTDFPEGATGVYVASDNGHWYFWNGAAWTDGGLYKEIISTINNLITTDAGYALDARQGPVITAALDTKAGHGYTGAAKTLKEVDDEKVSKTGDETIAGVKTFSGSPIIPTPTTDMQSSTKKYVDDADALRVLKSEQSITNKTLAEVLSTIDARILSLETFVKGNLGDITVNTINIIRGVNQYGSGGNAELKASGAPVVIPDYIGQQYTDTANGNIYKAKNNTAVADWVKIN